MIGEPSRSAARLGARRRHLPLGPVAERCARRRRPGMWTAPARAQRPPVL